jgi:predicted DsbA family dithiol-disulfide isomerase
VGAAFLMTIFLFSFFARLPETRLTSRIALLWMTGFASLVSFYYLIIMSVSLKTLCLLCLGIDAIHWIMFGILLVGKPWLELGEKRSQGQIQRGFQQWKGYLITFILCLVVMPVILKSATYTAPPKNEVLQQVDFILGGKKLPMVIPDDSPRLGVRTAKVVIQEFSDYQCPFCRNGAIILHGLLSAFPQDVQVIYRGFPLDMSCNPEVKQRLHDAACDAARVSHCAHIHGKFESVYKELFEKQRELSPSRILPLASAISGIDVKKLEDCLKDPKTDEKILRDIEYGKSLGVKSTPTFLVNGYKVEGALPPEVWEKLILRVLAEP